MGNLPESFMIYQEELRKARVEKERLQKEYEDRIKNLGSEMAILKEKLASQEEMVRSAFGYAIELEKKLEAFKSKMEEDHERNRFGFH